MDLSKEEVKILEDVKSGESVEEIKENLKNKIFYNLATRKLIMIKQRASHDHGIFMINGTIVGAELSPEAEVELLRIRDSNRKNIKNNFIYPLVIGIVGALFGAVFTYLMMK